ncbi:MAG: carboxylating nicotinate-nucleotide diphosphorylase [candidate division KSB1 bacterium]|jgi:nicotinate-nucleotide pyrophosphorylase (carboxylating)|nr:carboxylating nicotinate-nucleotide diphosphorylase [candidate division KSB1 bacterium]
MMQNLTELITNALQEDLGSRGDVTSLATISESSRGSAKIYAKAPGIIAGCFVVEKVYSIVDSTLDVDVLIDDGSAVVPGQDVIRMRGAMRSILIGERIALNYLCRLSGIATMTSEFVKQTNGTGVKIMDTRKTTPGIRSLEKYAVRSGGGTNHRSGLYDMFLIKENHIAAAGGITNAVTLAREYNKRNRIDLKIEVETRNLDEVKEALHLEVDRIMLDNMTTEQVKEAVAIVNKGIKLEISGGITLDNIKKYADTGVDYISIGGLTHSARALDLSLLVE